MEPAAGNPDRDSANMHLTPPDHRNKITKGVEEGKLCDTQSCRRINFTDVPVEIREKIYEFSLPSNLYYDVRSSTLVQVDSHQSSRNTPKRLPAMCYISSLERKIGLRTFLRTATMIYHNAPTDNMKRCLDLAANDGESGLALVTKLGIFYEKRQDYLDQELQGMVTVVGQFPALRGVTISFTMKALQEMHFGLYGVHWYYGCLSSSTILARYDLMRLVECSRLKRIDIVIQHSRIHVDREGFYRIMETVASHIKQAFFKANGREVEIEVEIEVDDAI